MHPLEGKIGPMICKYQDLQANLFWLSKNIMNTSANGVSNALQEKHKLMVKTIMLTGFYLHL